MASTGELVSWIKQAKSGWARENDIIPIIREVVNMLCKVEQASTIIIDPTTGRPPILNVTALNYGPYNGPANAWRVSNILLKQPIYDLDYNYALYYQDMYWEKPYVNTTERIEINGNWYYPFPFVKCTDAILGNQPQIMFSRNPGTTSTRYYMQAYQTPVQIMSDRIQLPIPDSFGAHRAYVFPACLALIEASDHGDFEKAVEYIEQVVKPRIWKVLNGGAQGNRHRVQLRPY